MDVIYIVTMPILLAIGITLGLQNMDIDDKYKWTVSIVRYILYILTIQGTKGLSTVIYYVLHKKRELDIRLLQNINRIQLAIYLSCVAILISNKQKFFDEDFPLIFIACLIVKYPVINKKPVSLANYGLGMACSFYEGYLMTVIPSDGGKFGGFEQNIAAFESAQGVVVPVKKLFLVITKTLHSPPDLEEFNKIGRNDLPRLESCKPAPLKTVDALFQSLESVEKSVAGVMNRIYKNSTYKIYRPALGGSPGGSPEGPRPVCLVAECATPLHTLHKVMMNRELYEELSVNAEDVANDFCSTLTRILSKSSECRDKIEIVHYDDTDPNANLADLLLNRIRELEPNFEELISSKN